MPPACQVHRPSRKHRKENESNLSGDQDSGTGQRETIENKSEGCSVNRRPDLPATNCSCGLEGCDLCLHTAHGTSVKRPLCSDTKSVHNASFDNISIHKVQNFRLSPDSGRDAGTPAQKPSLVTLFINKVKNFWMSSGSETSEDDSAFPKCSVHDKQVEFMCLGCDEVICLLCRLAEHDGHRTRSINLVIDEAMQRVRDARDRIQRFQNHLQKHLPKVVEENQQRRESLAQLRHNAEVSTRQRHSQLIQIMGETFGEGDEHDARVLRYIDEQRDNALRRLISMADATSDRFQTYDDYLNETLSALSELLQRAEQSLTNIDPSQVLRVDKEIEAAWSSHDICVRRLMALPCYTKTVQRDVERADALEMFNSSASAKEIEICIANFISHPSRIATCVLNAFPGWQISAAFRCCEEPETYVLSVCSYGEDEVAVSHTTSQDYSDGVTKEFNHDGKLIRAHSSGLSTLWDEDTAGFLMVPYGVHKQNPFPFLNISSRFLCSKSKRRHNPVCLLYANVTGWLLVPEHQMVNLMFLYLRAYGASLHDRLYEGVFEIQAVAPLLIDISEDKNVLAIVDVKDKNCSPLENNLSILERVVYCIVFSPDKTQHIANYQPPTSDFIPSDVCIVSKGDNPTTILLVSDMGSNSIHVVVLNSQLRRRFDGSVAKQYRCELLYYLVADCPLMKQPTALNIDRKGRVWVACKGGQILRVEKARSSLQ